MEYVTRSFPKVFQLGQGPSKDIFSGPVEITEKMDGSQIGFGVFDGKLWVRSKGVRGFQDDPPELFKPTIEHIRSVQSRLIPGAMYWGEAMKDRKHNTLCYEKAPRGNLVLFAVQFPDGDFALWEELAYVASRLECDVTPLLCEGVMGEEDMGFVKGLLDTESFLGGQNIEGIVIKNYNQDSMIGGQYVPFTAAKIVSEKFKEKHKVKEKENTPRGGLQALCESYRNENRWAKAVQHLREADQLEESPRDIGNLIKEIKQDIQEEEKEEIKDQLWRIFGKDVLVHSVKGFAEWYKERITTTEMEQ